MKALRWIILGIVTVIIGFFAWFKQREDNELDEAETKLAHGLKRSSMDQTFAHDMEPVQTFRDKGAV